MFQTDQITAASSLPTPATAGTPGYFTGGNPGAGVAATILDADFMNMVMLELSNIPAAASIAPSKTTYNQILTALKSMFSSVVGTMRNASMSVTAASASATFTADEIVAETALGGTTFKLSSFNKTINLATTGAGGMDTGTAPVSGYVALYAIYNPTTQTAALLATNAATLQGNVYGGANMPSGYTASALISVWTTNASKQFVVGFQADRLINIAPIFALSANVSQATSIALAVPVPANAKSISGYELISSTIAFSGSMAIAGTSTQLGQVSFQCSAAANAPVSGQFSLLMVTPQVLFYNNSISSGTPSYQIVISSYTF